MSRPAAWVRTAAVLALLVLAARVGGDDPLAVADIVRFLSAGISERTILTEVRERGFAEPMDEAVETTLREAGATETLIVAIRRAAPQRPSTAAAPVVVTPQGGAPVATAPAPVGRVPTFGASAKSVRVPVSVLDKQGRPILGLHGADFTIAEDGRRQEVTFFSGERRPLRIALALDVSTSMSTKMREVSEALRHFIDLLEPADEIMVLTFSADLHVEQDFTSDRDLLERVFSRLQPASGTALYDAAIEAIRRVAPGPAESKAVVLVTDGMDTASQASFEELREVARRSEVPVFSLGIGSDATFRRMFDPVGGGIRIPGRGPGRGPRLPGGWPGGGGGWPGGRGRTATEADFDARPLLDLAEDTGGRATILKGLERERGARIGRLQEAVEAIAVTLRHRYLVGYEPPSSKPGWRKIKVEVDRSPATVQARKGYYSEG
ncbi:MAG TPA: VWA domain-containing protein [Vicinamibacteria bacterium]|nr:VWA domain-containing protein [Vicinamibacteria bacterium]